MARRLVRLHRAGSRALPFALRRIRAQLRRRALLTSALLLVVGCARTARPDGALGPAREAGGDVRAIESTDDRRDEPRVDEPRAEERPGPIAAGLASWYGRAFEGRKTANGERFRRAELTAAHRTLPLGSCLRVRSVSTGREVRVRVNDRGPYAGKRILDLSEAAARVLGQIEDGVFRVLLFRC